MNSFQNQEAYVHEIANYVIDRVKSSTNQTAEGYFEIG